jgi:hypothetical protein
MNNSLVEMYPTLCRRSDLCRVNVTRAAKSGAPGVNVLSL